MNINIFDPLYDLHIQKFAVRILLQTAANY